MYGCSALVRRSSGRDLAMGGRSGEAAIRLKKEVGNSREGSRRRRKRKGTEAREGGAIVMN